MYRRSYERECITWCMGTSDVFKVAVGECNLRTLKTSRVTINHVMHEQIHTIFYLLCTQQNYFVTLLCTPCILHETLQCKCSRLFEPIKNIMLWQGKSSVKFLKVSEKIYAYKMKSKAKFQLFKATRILVRWSVFKCFYNSIGLSE